MFRAGPAGIRTTQAFSQECRWDTLDDDRREGCIRSREYAFSGMAGWRCCTATWRKMAVS